MDTSQETAATASPQAQEDSDILTLTLQYHGEPITLSFAPDATISDLSDTISSDLSIPPSNQKLLISPKPGLLRPPFKDGSLALSTLQNRKITLLGSTTAEVTSLHASIAALKEKQSLRAAALRQGRRATASITHRQTPQQRLDASTYTFASIKPLPYLPDPSKSQRFLERLAADPGIRSAMAKHKFSVGLLTEMNPVEHTTQHSRTLGLNRNAGEVIELRLRTDAYDGYRDYKVIRHTLCHELAHNVWGEHDARFWKLCKEIEGEVERGDWTRGGRSVGGEEFYNPADEGVDGHEDEGGWTGGQYVLGAGPASKEEERAVGNVREEGLSRREVLAKAAEERMKKQKDAEKQ
ncbi:hypothetical protein MBLNU457_3595t1 [Dothideomycetes sp. NU457]